MAMKRSIRSKVIVIIVILNLCEIQRTDAQLEAVGAVLSVVPVTSILATAGLVGVKLAALSRLLQALGYDRAYLAKGGAGSTDKPIGLQKNYAYMFPYVPGLNISVKDEHSPYTYSSKGAEKSTYIQQNGVAPDPIDSSGGGSTGNGPDSPHRKTYPAMGLPGDYETQTRPFRGSDILRDIFNRAGLNVALPTQEQKNAIKHKFVNIPDKGTSETITPLNSASQPATQQANNQLTPQLSTNIPHAIIPDSHNFRQRLRSNEMTIDTPEQLFRKPSSLSSQMQPNSQSNPVPLPSIPPYLNQPIGRPAKHNHSNKAEAKLVEQVNESAPQRIHNQPSLSMHDIRKPSPANHFFPTISASHPFRSKSTQINPTLGQPSSVHTNSAQQSASLSNLLRSDPKSVTEPLHPIPQHDYFYRSAIERQNARPPSALKEPTEKPPARQSNQLQTGQLLRWRIAPLDQPVAERDRPTSAFEEVNQFYGIPVPPPPSFVNTGSLTPSTTQSFPSLSDIVDGTSPSPNEITTNIVPNPYVNDDQPINANSLNDFDELNHVNRRRKRDADPAQRPSFAMPKPPSSSTRAITMPESVISNNRNQRKVTKTPNTFGYPAINIQIKED